MTFSLRLSRARTGVVAMRQDSSYYNNWIPRNWGEKRGKILKQHLIPESWALIWSWSPVCCYNSLYSRCWNIATGICFHLATRALVKSGTDVGRLGLAHSRCSNSGQGSVQASQVLPQRSRQTISVWSSLCAFRFPFTGTKEPEP